MGLLLDRGFCEATLPSSVPPISAEGGSVTAFLPPVLGNSYPSSGKRCSNGLGVLHLSLKIRNFVWKSPVQDRIQLCYKAKNYHQTALPKEGPGYM